MVRCVVQTCWHGVGCRERTIGFKDVGWLIDGTESFRLDLLLSLRYREGVEQTM